MSIEINRARVAADGTVTCEFVFPNIGAFVRVANDALQVEPAAFAPREATAPPYSHAEGLERRRSAAEAATGHRIPRAYMPPYDTTHGGQPLSVLMADVEEPPLRAFSADEVSPGGTD